MKVKDSDIQMINSTLYNLTIGTED